MVYHEWGNADNDRVLVCVHGLARNSRDFDDLALALSRDYRVICPDITGRGKSDWLPEGVAYDIPQYLGDITALLARLDVDKVDWVGTSMGGIIGMCLAALPNSPIRSLVLNDIGSFIPQQALQRISQYLGDHRFVNCDQVEQYMRRTYTAYAGLTDQQWNHLAQHGHRHLADDELALHYDPRLAQATADVQHQDIDLQPVWQQVTCPQLLIWGDQSDVLNEETVDQMQQHKPELDLYRIKGMGHAPSLMEPEQIDAVVRWLRDHRSR